MSDNTSLDWGNSLPDNIKADIDESIEQADRGHGISHEEVEIKYPRWFGNSNNKETRE